MGVREMMQTKEKSWWSCLRTEITTERHCRRTAAVSRLRHCATNLRTMPRLAWRSDNQTRHARHATTIFRLLICRRNLDTTSRLRRRARTTSTQPRNACATLRPVQCLTKRRTTRRCRCASCSASRAWCTALIHERQAAACAAARHRPPARKTMVLARLRSMTRWFHALNAAARARLCVWPRKRRTTRRSRCLCDDDEGRGGRETHAMGSAEYG